MPDMASADSPMETPAPKSSGELGQASFIEGQKGSDGARTEYDEYLDLKREFDGDRLKKLIRKVEYVSLGSRFGVPVTDMEHSFHVLPQLIIIYLMSYIDRTNVGMVPSSG